jgi:hypothetical protein
MPCHAYAALCRDLEKSLSERHGYSMARARHGICESNTSALCKSNGKDTITTLSGTAWTRHGNGMGAALRTAWARHGHGMGMAWTRHGKGMDAAWERH